MLFNKLLKVLFNFFVFAFFIAGFFIFSGEARADTCTGGATVTWQQAICLTFPSAACDWSPRTQYMPCIFTPQGCRRVDPQDSSCSVTDGVCTATDNLPTTTDGCTVVPDPTPTPCVDQAPSAPGLSAPANGTVTNVSPQTLSWTAPSSWGFQCDGSYWNRYRVYSCTGAGCFPSNVLQDWTTNTSYSWGSLVSGTVYGWRVEATNGSGETGKSANWYFTYDTTGPSCSSLTPNPAAAKAGTTVNLTAIATDNVSVYQIETYVNAATDGSAGGSWSNSLCAAGQTFSGSPVPRTCTWTPPDGGQYAGLGLHRLASNAVDSAGNIANQANGRGC